jgi:hypothetical protein
VSGKEWEKRAERAVKVSAYWFEKFDAADKRIKRLEEALRKIANTDYRGNRSTESQIAFEAMKEAK